MFWVEGKSDLVVKHCFILFLVENGWISEDGNLVKGVEMNLSGVGHVIVGANRFFLF